MQTLTGKDRLAALADCDSRGVRGGVIFDWLQLAAARMASAERLSALDPRDFQWLVPPSDPRIAMPSR
jgi:hypothetical protein